VTVTVNIVIAVGMLFVVPVGLALIGGPGLDLVRRLWPIAAVPAAVSLWLPAGAVAVALAAPYALMTLVLGGCAVTRFARVLSGRVLSRAVPAAEVAVLTALVTPVVAATALLAGRAGYRLFGFPGPILRLTVAHFHFAGFAAALIAALVCRWRGGWLATAAALTVPAGTVVVFAGFFTSWWVQFAGAAILTTGMWLTGWITWREIRPAAPDWLTRALLGVSALVLTLTMALALDWSLGHAAGLPHLSLTWMVATHGVANAAGFAVCGLAAWYRLRQRVPERKSEEIGHASPA